MKTDETLYILDGYGLIYRAYHAFSATRPLYNTRGENIAAVLAFFRSLFAFFRTYEPQLFLIALDSKSKSFRFDLYAEYKANRQKTPQDLHSQTQIIEEILAALEIPSLRCEGFEADDIIATIAQQRKVTHQKTCILSADKDLMQLVDEYVQLLRPGKDDFVLFDAQGVFENKHVWPHQIRDYLAMVGDSSDNIPGIKGVGEKSAIKLLNAYENIDNIYAHIAEIAPPSLQKKLQEGKSGLQLSLQLVDLQYQVPLHMGDLALGSPINFGAGAQQFAHFEIPSLAKYCLKFSGQTGTPSHTPHNTQRDLFSHSSAASQTLMTASTIDHCDYQLVTDLKDIAALMQTLEKKSLFAFDCETTGLDTTSAQLVGMSFCYAPSEAFYIPLLAPGIGIDSKNQDEILTLVKPVLESPASKIIGQNLKFDMKILRRYGIKFSPYFDTMIAAWLLDSESRVNLDFLGKAYLHRQTIAFADIVPKGSNFSHVALEIATPYACEDADLCLQLYHIFEKKLQEKSLSALFYTLEMPLISILAEMELAGIQVNKDSLRTYSYELGQSISQLEQDIYHLAGITFNLNSPKQLQQILFEVLKLPTGKKNSSGFTTDAQTLQYLANLHPLPQKMLDYRQLAKLKSTYTDALIDLCAADGRIHCDFIQVGASTGRLSCQNPNLQNLPVRTQEGRRIRNAFESRPGHMLISADYSQIELVILAYLAKENHMLEVFENGRDLHQETAAFIFGISAKDVSPDQRRAAKSVNFGILYGMSAFRLSNELKIPRAQAEQFIQAYFQRYAQIENFIQKTTQTALAEGGVHTVLGRWRPIPYIHSQNKNEQAAAQRMAVNTVIQGSAADIIKQAMLHISDELYQGNLATKLLLQVHDELILEAPDVEIEIATLLVERNMRKASLEINIPMKIGVQVESGKNWGLFH
ncbi:MAG: DNA polymerase I [Spirochaetia bacterium]